MTEPAGLTADLVEYGQDALAVWRAAVARVTPADLSRPTPCAEFTVADLADHVQRSMVLLAGAAGTELDVDAGRPSLEQSVPLAAAALAVWAQRGVDGSVPVGSLTYPAEKAYAIVLMELAVHGWDLDRALGAPAPELPGPLGDYLLAAAPQLITPDRRGRAFAEEVAVDVEAALVDRLVGFTGRRP